MLGCYPWDAWLMALILTNSRWQSFKFLWKFNGLMTDTEIMEALSTIIKGGI